MIVNKIIALNDGATHAPQQPAAGRGWYACNPCFICKHPADNTFTVQQPRCKAGQKLLITYSHLQPPCLASVNKE